MSLRVRLVALVAVLLAVGMSVAALATLAALRYFLVSRTDTQLDQLSAIVGAQMGDGGGLGPSDLGNGRLASAGGQPFVLLRVLSPDGTPMLDLQSPVGQTPTIQLQPEAPSSGNPDGGVYTTVTLADQQPKQWRVRSGWLPDRRAILQVGLPLTDYDTVNRQLIRTEVAATVVILVAIVVIAWWVIGLGTRPLDRIARTAGEIGAGRLDLRVSPARPNTEIGRLSTALNAMLVQIQTAFQERQTSEERLRRFVADASHELNTPVATIRGYAELFRHGAGARPADLEVAMRRIESEATRMGQLVNELLVLAKLDEGRPLDRAQVDLTHLATEAVADARAIDPDRPLSVQAPGSIVMSGDELRLRQLLANLLSNVRRHTPPGTAAEVRLSTSDGVAVIEVADDGPGLTEEDSRRVFERFYRSATSRGRQREGSGIGLAIVAAIAEAHGGTAEVTSVPGEGTVFTVRIPCDEQG
ncbi:HAMP domain-containing histidine kinase [Micromonospora sp. KC207]|uniref:sensor histidine kinase n=1 Tax=Micromonospora sp. KC207 TaxID=2530377 RepID=UPI0010538292|nr:HAMP domain-containing sensor histidine kinase [Micromonospora sp. KC207]TDC58885.1 HAMP domain-containing histidine kinase [Micromonospora sp. KC207]